MEPPTILLAFANDRDAQGRHLPQLVREREEVSTALQPAVEAGHCRLELMPGATIRELLGLLQGRLRDRVAIFHYGGHASAGTLELEGEKGGSDSAHAEGLAQVLGQQDGLELVFLNGCSTEAQAAGLNAAQVAAVIATDRAIDDAVAADFARHFYAGLAHGASLAEAFDEAEGALKLKGGKSPQAFYRSFDVSSPAPTDWPWQLHLAPDEAERVRAWSLPAAAGDETFGLPRVPRAASLPPLPFRPLAPFEPEHAELFFGRGRTIRALYQLLVPREGVAPRVVVVAGPAGAGRSSLLRAGVIPRLGQVRAVRLASRSREVSLRACLSAALGGAGDDAALATAWRELEQREGRPAVLFLDELELASSQGDGREELGALVTALARCLSEPGLAGGLVLSTRAEWNADLVEALRHAGLPHRLFSVAPPSHADVLAAVQGVVASPRLREEYGISLEEGLADTIADDMLADRRSPTASTLQLVLAALWERSAASGRRFTVALYEQLKRQGLLLAGFVDQQLAQVRARFPGAVDSGLVLDLLEQHTTPLGVARSRSAGQLQAHYDHCVELWDLVALLKEVYLLAGDARLEPAGPRGGTRLAHDTVAPVVRARWASSDRPGQRARRILDARCADPGAGSGREVQSLDRNDLALVEAGLTGTRVLQLHEARLLARSQGLRRARRHQRILGRVALVVLGAALVAMTLRALQRMDQAVQLEAEAKAAAEGLRHEMERVELILEREREALRATRRDRAEARAALQRELRAAAEALAREEPAQAARLIDRLWKQTQEDR